ncbi:AraC family transcriptional regulator ligand-binding domain-containing protein [Psychromonas sp. KJ10-2]|uniref:AraC family transcriptional regulator ligand-binding domain-containing protein n=1 Tax=Psychromonas sp. KJ10-2 TaxID=3391822 RepID=UPI0039B544D7
MLTKNTPEWLEATDAFISIQCGTAQLVDMLCQAGEHPDVLLSKTRLFMDDFEDIEKRITPQQLAQLYFNATLSEGHDALALKLGQRILPTALGTFSNGLIHAPDLDSAIHYLVNSCALWSPLLSLHIKHHDKQLYLTFTDRFGLLADQTLKQFVIAYSLSAIDSIISWISEQQLVKNWVLDIEDCNQQTALEFNAWFPAKIQFQQAYFAVSIPERLLAHPFNQASHILFTLDHKRLVKQTASQVSLLNIIRSKIIDNIQTIPAANDIADQLFISTATLKRKLKKHKTNYQTIVDEMRAREVYFLQKKQQLSDIETAQKLNFYDVSNLRRAKRRWAVP